MHGMIIIMRSLRSFLNNRQLLKSVIQSGQQKKMMSESVFSGKDDTQVKLMQERCILVDVQDKAIGDASKKECHLLKNIEKGMLHRAFSVFLFDSSGRLLLQQRSDHKITYPDHWTNTCCSHPLAYESEMEETDAVGVIRAARRKLNHELGIQPNQVPAEAFTFLTRILYKSANVPDDGTFGEHEIDYILFIQKDVDVNANNNEVKDFKYVNQQELSDMMGQGESGQVLITPWFKLIEQQFLGRWWQNLSNLQPVKDTDTIHNMIKS